MKKIIAIISIYVFTIGNMFAQAPEKMNYQGVARDNGGNILANQTVGLQLSIHTGTPTGTVVYTETQTPTTNQFGLFNIEFGGGAGFNTINWGGNSYYLQVEMDASGGSSYQDMGTSQLLSVPYALNAKTSSDNKWLQTGNNISNVNTNYVGIGTTTPASKLHIVAPNDEPILRLQPQGWFGGGSDSASHSATIDLWSTFENYPFDQTPRRTAVIKGLFDGGAWENETLSFGVGRGVTNDAALEPLERMRITGNGNVGIATTAPAEKLEVQGNLRLSTSAQNYVTIVVPEGNQTTTYNLPPADGEAGQSLQTNGNGSLNWGSSGNSECMTNMKVYDYTGNGSNSTYTFTVPSGVTKVKVEIWSGGGHGNVGGFNSEGVLGGGGGGGGYVRFFQNVSANQSINVTVPKGGGGGQAHVAIPSILSISIFNGSNADTVSTDYNGGQGGYLNPFFVGLSAEDIYTEKGQEGLQAITADATTNNSNPYTSGYICRMLTWNNPGANMGNGGSAANSNNTGGMGGFIAPAGSSTLYCGAPLGGNSSNYAGRNGRVPGGGGGGGGLGNLNGGGLGAPGRVIVWY